MAKVKRQMPTSIRLSPAAVQLVERIQASTGWSVSKVLEYCVMIQDAINSEKHASVKLQCELMRQACRSHQLIGKADEMATQARSALRKAATAVKGAK